MTAPGAPVAPGGPDPGLSRELGVRSLAAVIVNYVVGAGIFVLPAFAADRLGPAAVLAYLVCVAIIVLTVACFAAAGSRVAGSGGPYAYVEAAFGPLAGFLAGILNLLSCVVACGLVAGFFASSVLALGGVTAPFARPIVITLAIALATAINVSGVRGGARLVELSVVAKLAPLACFIVAGAFAVRLDYLSWPETPPASSVFGTAGLIILAFAGVEGALQPSGEVRDPARTVPRAAFLAMAGVVTIYIAVQLVSQGILGPALTGADATPLATAFGRAYGPAGRTLMLIGAAVSMFGFLCGAILTGPRSVFALGRDGFAPRVLGTVHPVRRTPAVAILVFAVVAAGLGLSGSVERLAIVTNLASLVVYMAVALAAWRLQARGVRLEGDPFPLPAGPLVPVLACGVIATVIAATVSRVEMAAVTGVTAVACAAYGVRALRPR